MSGEITPVALLLMIAGGVISFALGRYFSRGWRAKRQQKELAAKRASETRQQRRARERREKR